MKARGGATRWASVAALMGLGACGNMSASTGNAIAKVATAAAIEAAAVAVSKSVTGCYTTCAYGTACNASTGICEPAEPCNTGDPACGKTPAYDAATSPRAPATSAAPEAPMDESCAGFCLSSERCVVYRGDLDCVPR